MCIRDRNGVAGKRGVVQRAVREYAGPTGDRGIAMTTGIPTGDVGSATNGAHQDANGGVAGIATDGTLRDIPHRLLARMVGEWEGTYRLWFERDMLASESVQRGSLRLSLIHI